MIINDILKPSLHDIHFLSLFYILYGHTLRLSISSGVYVIIVIGFDLNSRPSKC